MDMGYIFYDLERNGIAYPNGARCKCLKGQNRREKAIPCIDSVRNGPDLYELANSNREVWITKNPGEYAHPITDINGKQVQEKIPFEEAVV